MASRGKKANRSKKWPGQNRAAKKNPAKKIQKGNYVPQDRFFDRAKQKGFRSRSAFKLIEICNKFKLLRHGMVAIDLGCAPGGWLQVLSKGVGSLGNIIGVDLEAIKPLFEKNATFIRGDITSQITQQRVLAALGRKVDAVFSDMAPNLSGIKFQDHFNSYQLALKGFEFCRQILREGGDFVVKTFPGEEFENLTQILKTSFQRVSTIIPEATRKTSNEIYLIAQGFSPTP